MDLDKIVSHSIKEFLNVEVHRDTEDLDYLSKIEIVKRKISRKVRQNPDLFSATTLEEE
ncbi:hypothetical protein NBT05_15195 [Aquimarina sp. ERC-38]|uniref:hypothetical protein n=1 Tax=Aquimarina sp. ERC-38 TaxID=2949996 RepID=UPI00224786B6|nr:hypothetical protein [Aquimarina sp. ERC-38]UZO80288.1 hypothetical protein NBT05_15195 [Aquimarina sp. ERC-38]